MLCCFINTSWKCMELNCASPTLHSIFLDLWKVIIRHKWAFSVCPIGYILRKLGYDHQKNAFSEMPQSTYYFVHISVNCGFTLHCSLDMQLPGCPWLVPIIVDLHSLSLFSTCLMPKLLGLPVDLRSSQV